MTDASERIQQTLRQFEEQVQKAAQLKSAIQDMHGTAASPDGAVTVTVAPSGAVLDLRLSPNAVRQSHTDLQQAILAAIREATQNAADQLNETVAPVLGEQFDQFQEAFNANAARPLGPDAVSPGAAPQGNGHGRATDTDDDDDFGNESFLR
ncbi:YbaB/EbfC family nucleoid-associated protein [Saccharopolyspora erythraea]|uniref:YbaB/EbfC family nucleoid-associated protein n=1 Tax=Saccharopolyspora erythraea TaxID=1836 RepID=UPI001BA5002E|nr:YbaB/EbfC family nucleoid-associated protein [Saccharopolyspora erythraea]QUH04765.1 YbaB/EbfC family nucleoid-associated protein [Saccharopolyspora erythraea]